jgi:hypothetical protein
VLQTGCDDLGKYNLGGVEEHLTDGRTRKVAMEPFHYAEMLKLDVKLTETLLLQARHARSPAAYTCIHFLLNNSLYGALKFNYQLDFS